MVGLGNEGRKNLTPETLPYVLSLYIITQKKFQRRKIVKETISRFSSSDLAERFQVSHVKTVKWRK